MKPTVLLFDIDGTLITTGGVGRRAIELTLDKAEVAIADSFNFSGMTDRAIVRRHLEAARCEVSEARIDAILEDYLPVLEREVRAAPADGYRLHDGMLDAIARAEQRAHTAIGLGTGNIERGARIKLERVDVSRRFAFGGFGCDSEDRAELLLAGAERGAARLGCARTSCRVVVIGDTPKDIAAAKAIGADSLAVATGHYDVGALRPHRPTHLFASLAAPGALAALLEDARND
jgi:phosphoglycolate phosphatase-like HAD superfamily hydrolase